MGKTVEVTGRGGRQVVNLSDWNLYKNKGCVPVDAENQKLIDDYEAPKIDNEGTDIVVSDNSEFIKEIKAMKVSELKDFIEDQKLDIQPSNYNKEELQNVIIDVIVNKG